MTFTVAVDEWTSKAEKSFELTIKAVSIKLFSAIIESSPVDEGTFRNNWYVTADTPSTEVNPNAKGGSNSGAISEMSRKVLGLFDYQNINFTNNLPYSEVIEYGGYPKPAKTGNKTVSGYSTQAPQGVVRVNAVRFEQLIQEEAQRVSNR